MNGPMDVIAAVLLLTGAVFSLTAGLGLLRFPDLLSRLHTGSKPQTVGLIAALVAVGLRTEAVIDFGIIALIVVFQLATAPIAAHMIGRAAYRSGHARADILTADELSEEMSRTQPSSQDPEDPRTR